MEMSPEGIRVGFMGGLEGIVKGNMMHPNTHFDVANNNWLFLQNAETAYAWTLGAKVSFKIAKVCTDNEI